MLGAGAGAFAVLAVEELVVKITSTNATAPGILLNAALAVAALAAAMFVVGPLRGAAVVALVFSIPLFWIFVFYGNGQSGSGWFRLVYLLSALIFLALYSLLWTRGRAVFLALTLLFAAAYIQLEVHRQFETVNPRFEPQTVVPIPLQLVTNPSAASSVGNAGFAGLITRTGDVEAAVALVLGVGFLVAGGVLIRRKYAGAAVAFLVIGALEGFAAAAVLGPNESSVVFGGLLAAAVGAILAVAGAGEGRRGAVWIGVIAVVVSLTAVIADATTDDLGRAGYYALAAVGLLVIATILVQVLHEAPDGGEPATK